MLKLDLEKAEEPEIKLLTSIGSLKKQESSRKTSTSALLTMPKPLTVWITTNCGRRLEYQITLPASCETCAQVKEQQLEPDMQQWIGSTLGNEYVNVTLILQLTCRVRQAKCCAGQSTSWNQDCQEKYQ